MSATCDRPQAEVARARPASGSTRTRKPAACECTTALKSHAKTPLCHRTRLPCLGSVVTRAQGTGPGRWSPCVPSRVTFHSSSSRGRRAGLWGAGAAAPGNSVLKKNTHTHIHTYIHSGLTGLRHARAPHFPDSRLGEPVIGKAKGGCRPQIQSGQSVALNPRAPDGPRPTAHTPVLQ